MSYENTKRDTPMTKKQFIESYAVWIESNTNKAAFHLKDVERMLDKYSDQQNKELKEALKDIIWWTAIKDGKAVYTTSAERIKELQKLLE